MPNEDSGSRAYFFFLARLAAFFLAPPLRFFAAAIGFPLYAGRALANPMHHPTQHHNTNSITSVALILYLNILGHASALFCLIRETIPTRERNRAALASRLPTRR